MSGEVVWNGGGRSVREGVWTAVGEVVVVFDGLEGGAFAEQTEVVDGDGFGEEGLDGLVDVSDLFGDLISS